MLLFEAMVVELAKSQPVRTCGAGRRARHPPVAVRQTLRGRGTPVRGLHGRAGDSIDGTGRKGRNCITVVADQAERNVVRVVPGKDAHTVERFVQDFMDRNGDPNRVGLVTCDMSLEFARGICEHLPNAAKVIDKFHIVKHANEAVDRGRRAEGGHNTKYLCLRNETNPPEPQLEIKRSLRRRRPRTARACRMCEPCRTSAPTAPTGSGPKRGPKHCARG